jgi:hypothetical protein
MTKIPLKGQKITEKLPQNWKNILQLKDDENLPKITY